MEDFNKLANTPVEMEIAGKKYLVRRISLNAIFGKAEAAVLSTQMKRIREMAAGIEEEEERSSFLAKAMLESLPSGARLSKLSSEFLRSPQGVQMVVFEALRADQPNIENELDLMEAIRNDDQGIQALVQYLIGRSEKRGKENKLPLAGQVGG